MAKMKILPFAVEASLKKLGANIHTARVRRNISLADLANRIGVHRTVLSDAEHGKPGTAASVYVSMLWAMDLLDDLNKVANPDSDEKGLALARFKEPSRASTGRQLDDNF
jgi:transcriptional regulator with XRE-family HTH domain